MWGDKKKKRLKDLGTLAPSDGQLPPPTEGLHSRLVALSDIPLYMIYIQTETFYFNTISETEHHYIIFLLNKGSLSCNLR